MWCRDKRPPTRNPFADFISIPLYLIYLFTTYPEYTVLVTVSKLEPIVSQIARINRRNDRMAGTVRMKPSRCGPPETGHPAQPEVNNQLVFFVVEAEKNRWKVVCRKRNNLPLI